MTENVFQSFWQSALPPSFSTLSNACHSNRTIASTNSSFVTVCCSISEFTSSLCCNTYGICSSRYVASLCVYPFCCSNSTTPTAILCILSMIGSALFVIPIQSTASRIRYRSATGNSFISIDNSCKISCPSLRSLAMVNRHFLCGAYVSFNRYNRFSTCSSISCSI